MPKKLNVRDLLKNTEYDHLADILAIKIEGWGLDNDRDIYSLPVHGKVCGVNPNLIVEALILQSKAVPEESVKPEKAEEPIVDVYEDSEEEPDWLRATPAALELAKEHEIDLSAVDGSGKDGTVVKKDIEQLINLEEDKHDH